MKTEFEEYLQSRKLSQASQGLYTRYVNSFLNWYKHDPINCQKKDMLRYLKYLKDKKGYQNITRRNILMAIGYYFTVLQKQELTQSNPTHFIKIRGVKKRSLYHTFSFEELTQLADDYYHYFIRNYNGHHIPKNKRKQSFLSKERNYCMLCLLLYQGLHTNELQRITLADVNLNKAQIHIQSGKKSNERNVPLNASQIGSLMLYLQDIRPQLLSYQNQDTQAVFLPLPEIGKAKTNHQNLMGIITSLTTQTKILHNDFLNFKQVRASVITYWIQTLGLRKAQYLAGHRYISSTENYLPNDLESLTEEIGKFNPF